MQNGSAAKTHVRVKMTGITATTFGEIVLTTLKSEFGAKRHASKLLAKVAQTSHRTAEKWLAGTSTPSGENLINLLAECDALADELNRLVAERRKERHENH